MSYPQYYPQSYPQSYPQPYFDQYAAENAMQYEAIGGPVVPYEPPVPIPHDWLNPNAPLMSPPVELEGTLPEQTFNAVVERYISDLSAKKRDKALITVDRYQHIRAVLSDPKATIVQNAQFRFWAKRMFSLEHRNYHSERQVCHDGKPVAIKEGVYIILTNAHVACRHGGRDKTSEKVRQFYSWVPKELIARYVKLCPTCRVRRGAAGDDEDVNPVVQENPADASAVMFPVEYQQQTIPESIDAFAPTY